MDLLKKSISWIMANVLNHTKCISLSNQLFMAGATFIDLNPN